ncbi:MAG: ABC transporter ATP-binding protein [Coriobacteriales bacterium]
MHYYVEVTRKHRGYFWLAMLSTIGFVFLLTYANAWILAEIVDIISTQTVAADEVFIVFGPYIAMLIIANAGGQACSKLQDYAAWKLEIAAAYDLATMCFDTLSNQSMTFHSNKFGGSLVSQTQKFMSAYSILIENVTYSLVPIVSSAIFTIVMLVGAVPIYVAILIVFLVVYVIVAYRLFITILPLNKDAASAQNALSGELSDSITNIMSVKTFGREEYERSIFDKANRRVVEADSKRMRSSTWRGALSSGIIVAIMVVLSIFIVGGNPWFGISAGTLVMMFTYTYSVTMQFNRINLLLRQINHSLGDAHDMTEILDEPRLVDDVPDAKPLTVTDGTIDIENLNFWYSESTESNKVFEDFSLHIPGGQRVGLVGRSGSGKTTLTKLILRLSDVQEGRILIDGQDISQVTQTSLRQQIGYVPQEPLLFHRTIRENIAYGKPDATDEEVRQAAIDANAMEFIEKLPQKFETMTGERGVKLSGGQRQRIAIARAILADTPILILDEATSALDSESERLVQEALGRLMNGRTSIVVAHRLSTVASLDRIVVLSEGKVVEDGTHQQLLDEGGEYSQLWSRQTGAFLDMDA